MKPRTLIVHVDNDQWLISDKARAAAQAIPGAQYAGLSSPIAHYAVFSALNTLADDPMLNTFVRDIGIVEDKTKVCDAAQLPQPARQHEAGPGQVVLEGRDGVAVPGQVRQGQGQARRRMGDRLHRRVLRQGQEPAGARRRARQGRLRRALRLPDQVRGRARLPRDRARHAAVGHVGAGQPRQADDPHARRRARRVPCADRRQARREEGLLSRPLARRRHRARLRAALSGCGARPDPRGAGGARGVSEEHQARRQGAAAVRQVLRLRPQALGGGLRPDRHGGRRRQAHRAGRARLLLLQAARSEDRTPSRPATTATSRSTPSTRGCTPTSASR